MFLFAHQDDEYAAAPWILEELAAGSSIACLYLTNGNRRVDPAVRDAESRSVLRSLGVRDEAIVFLGEGVERIGDQQLASRSLEGLAHVERWIEETGCSPSRIYAPSYEGGHPDHDATHLIAAILAAQHDIECEAWHFALYNAYRHPRPFFATLKQLPSEAPRRKPATSFAKRWALSLSCRAYRSQWRTWLGLFPGALMARAVFRSECVVRFEFPRLGSRPHDGELLYERLFATRYEDFANDVAALRVRLAELRGTAG